MFQIYKGDCLDVMDNIEPGSVDLVLCDPPYGTTACAWDSVVPLDQMWEKLIILVKQNSPIVLFSAQPFSAALIMSNPDFFRYELVWKKSRATGHLNAKKMPMRQHENILVFSEKKLPTYFPQMREKASPRKAQASVKAKGAYRDSGVGVFREVPNEVGYPTTVLEFNDAYHDRESGLHPTQKPVALMEYLIETYSRHGGTVLDFTMGSGTTGVAAMNTGRKFIGIEMDEAYFKIAKSRIEQAEKENDWVGLV